MMRRALKSLLILSCLTGILFLPAADAAVSTSYQASNHKVGRYGGAFDQRSSASLPHSIRSRRTTHRRKNCYRWFLTHWRKLTRIVWLLNLLWQNHGQSAKTLYYGNSSCGRVLAGRMVSCSHPKTSYFLWTFL